MSHGNTCWELHEGSDALADYACLVKRKKNANEKDLTMRVVCVGNMF